MAQVETWYTQDLKQPVKVRMLPGNVFSQDNLGNLIGVHVFDDGEPAVLSGTVSGNVIRADGGTVAVTGSLTGNDCYIILPEAAYSTPGPISVIIKLTGGGSTTTLCAVVANVYQASTDTPVDPGAIIPSIQDLIDAINDAVASIPQDYSSLDALAYDTVYQYGLYKYGQFKQPFDARILDILKTVSAIGTYDETYGDGSRAVYKINGIIDGKLTIHNPSKYLIGVYYRQKSNNEYMGYAQNASSLSCISISGLDTSAYDYYIIVINTQGGTETEWTVSALHEANRNIFVYTGGINDNQSALSVRVPSNLISPEIIHVGKYYYGAATPASNPDMSYTDLVPVKGGNSYCFPYMTIGYSWYEADETTVIGGEYVAVENIAQRPAYIVLTAPLGASFVGVSVRSGDAGNMVLSEFQNSKSKIEHISSVPVAKSKVVREPLNWIYDMKFTNTMAGSRIQSGNTVTFDGEKAILGANGTILSADQICMDKSKMDIVFSIPENTSPSFLLGTNGYYAKTSLGISDGAIGVWFKADGTAEVRMGTGQAGSYTTVLASLDLSDLQINNGRKYIFSLEKDTINRYIVSVYDALTPENIATVTVEAEQNPQDENLYTGQVRGWGGPYAVNFGNATVNIYSVRMYSTAPTYPHIALWGDSYIENMGRNPRCSYANLLREVLNGNVFISGQGGATAQQTSYRMAAEINSCAPQYVVINVGVNDSFNVTVDEYKAVIIRLIEMVKESGAVPILVTIPNVPAGNATTRAFCETANPWIRSLGYDYIDIAYALSTGDGITGDTGKFVSDMMHPNLAGGQAIYNYIKAHLPMLLWK